MRELREYRLEKKDTFFFADASVLHWPLPVFLSFVDNNRRKSDDSMNVGKCDW